MQTIGFIGVGKMATAIISGLDKNKFEIIISGHNLPKTKNKLRNLMLKLLKIMKNLFNNQTSLFSLSNHRFFRLFKPAD